MTRPAINTADALAFARLVFRGEPTEWRLIHPHRAWPDDTRHLWGYPETAEELGALADYNGEGFGVYAVINRCAATVEQRCARKKAARDRDVTAIRAFFADLDLEDAPGANAAKLAAAPLPPSIVVRSSLAHKLQAYWLLEPGHAFPISDFRRVQKGLVAHFDSDNKVVNESRVMRVPGFFHTKGEPILSVLLEAHQDRVYTPEEVLDAFGIPREAPAPIAAPRPVGGPVRLRGGLRQARYVFAAVQGEYDVVATASEGTRNDTLHKAAVKLGSLVGAGVLLEADARDALELAAEHCGLPASEARHTVDSGMAYGKEHPRDLGGLS